MRRLLYLALVITSILGCYSTSQAESTALRYKNFTNRLESSILKAVRGETSPNSKASLELSTEGLTFTSDALIRLPIFTKLNIFSKEISEISVLQNDINGAGIREADKNSGTLWISITFKDSSAISFVCYADAEIVPEILSGGTPGDDGRISFFGINALEPILSNYAETKDIRYDDRDLVLRLKEIEVSKYSSKLRTAVQMDRIVNGRK